MGQLYRLSEANCERGYMKCAISEKAVNHGFETDSTLYIFKNTVFRTHSGLKLKGETDCRVFIKNFFLLGYWFWLCYCILILRDKFVSIWWGCYINIKIKYGTHLSKKGTWREKWKQ